MEAKRFSGLIACLLLLGWGPLARPARALEYTFGEEQRVQIHGFYETQLRFLGEDTPFGGNGLTFSQFRHILDIETDIDIFPDGKGPFDMLTGFTRWLITYECIYSRACGVFSSADSYATRGNRLPNEYKRAKTSGAWIGGYIFTKTIPGTNVPTIQELNPGWRYNSPIQPPGRQAYPTAFPLGALANLNTRTLLDTPIDDVARFNSPNRTRTRAGAFNDRGAGALLDASRGVLSEERFAELDALPILNPRQAALARAYQAAGMDSEADAILAGTLNAESAELLGARSDKNRWEVLASSAASDLLTMKWGASQGEDTIYSVLMTLDTELRPAGYFTGGALNAVSEWAPDLAETATLESGVQVEGAIPFFVGPDGERNTTDDLPIGPGKDGLRGYTEILPSATPEECDAALPPDSVGGVNALGQCIRIPDRQPANSQGDVAIADDLRPDSAFLEPQNLTGLNALGGQNGLPGRPRNPNGGLWYKTQGVDRLIKRSDNVVGNLDTDFREDELKWSHGASQDEHEFREGFLEFEMFDSQLFARLGKLVMVWGKTELFRNQDRLNPTDIGIVTLANLEESRIGQWAADVTWYWGFLGPAEDVRFEFVTLFDDFEPTDLGKCGEPFVFLPVCAKSFGQMASGLVGLGLVGEVRPPKPWDSWEGMDVAVRMEGRWDRFTFAISDFWGWDDSAILEVVHEYGRRVDPETGAPVQVTGNLTCKTAPGGPTGVNGTGTFPDNPADDDIPFKGNCLLFNDDGTLRNSNDIALNHYANQTLFHTICALTFDEDTGYCALDSLNSATLAGPGSLVLAGDPGFQNAAVVGFETIRSSGTRFQGLDVNVDAAGKLFGQLQGLPELKLSELPVDQQALLGCGPRFATGCITEDAQIFTELGILEEPAGGIDFMNADGSVLTQEFSALKYGSPGNLVGHRRSGASNYFEAGVTAPDVVLDPSTGAVVPFNPDVAIKLESLGPPGTATLLVTDPESPYVVEDTLATDFQIEPFPWQPVPDLLEKGALVFDTSTRVPGGENCTKAEGGPDSSCTNLEILSANLERLLMTNEIIGADDMFDPPESFEELVAMIDLDERNDLIGDPLSGPDGIFFNNVDTDGDGLRDSKAIRVESQFVQSETFVDDPLDCLAFPNLDACYLDITDRLIASGEILAEQAPEDPNGVRSVFWVDAKPVIRLRRQAEGETPASNVQSIMDDIPPVELQRLIAGEGVPFKLQDTDLDGVDDLAVPADPNDPDAFEVRMQNSVRNRLVNTSPTSSQDLDRNEVPDLDEDADTMLDFADDALFDDGGNLILAAYGPVSDDNIFCGSGIPGDPLQGALQFEFYNRADEARLGTLFPEFNGLTPSGLPPRSPVYCRSLGGLLGVTGYTLPYKRAGGDTVYGRRDFLWHGGRQVTLNYQKKNVFGFGLDFAEDRTKSSWGVEFSWTSGKLFGNTLSRDGLHQSDEYVLSLSMDRPTFINFLNPNRTFFINFQIFFKYFPDYVGDDDIHDGMYGTSSSPFDTRFILFFFTGYFQDRLTPRVTLVADPFTSSGAVLTQLSYRFTDRFSAQLGLNQFFGHQNQIQSRYFPISLNTNPDSTSEAIRGISPAKNRDEIFVNVRWTF